MKLSFCCFSLQFQPAVTTQPLWDLHTNCTHQEFPVEAKAIIFKTFISSSRRRRLLFPPAWHPLSKNSVVHKKVRLAARRQGAVRTKLVLKTLQKRLSDLWQNWAAVWRWGGVLSSGSCGGKLLRGKSGSLLSMQLQLSSDIRLSNEKTSLINKTHFTFCQWTARVVFSCFRLTLTYQVIVL